MIEFLKLIPNIISNLLRFFKMLNLNNKNFFIKEYRKSVTVYKNGHGFVVNSLNINVLKPNETKQFKRRINIAGSKKQNKFPTLSKMLETSKIDRFTSFGFWCSCDKNDVVQCIEEKYWNYDENEDVNSRDNPRELKWIIEFNSNNLRKNDNFNITYTFSIPDMYPIDNFKFDGNNCPNTEDTNMYCTTCVEHYLEKMVYIIAFEKDEEKEKGMDFKSKPLCTSITKRQNSKTNKKPISGKNISDNFYERYEFTVNKPKFNDIIKISWEFNK